MFLTWFSSFDLKTMLFGSRQLGIRMNVERCDKNGRYFLVVYLLLSLFVFFLLVFASITLLVGLPNYSRQVQHSIFIIISNGDLKQPNIWREECNQNLCRPWKERIRESLIVEFLFQMPFFPPIVYMQLIKHQAASSRDVILNDWLYEFLLIKGDRWYSS